MRTAGRIGRAAALATLSLVGLPLMATPAAAAGVIDLTTLGTPYIQDFNTLAATGTSSVVPLGWEFSESGTNANTIYTAGTGSSQTGDTYSFGAAGVPERAFGGLRSGSLVPMVGAQFRNSAGTNTITSLSISYTGEQWRLGQNTAGRATDRLDFQLSTDATSLTTGTWTDQDALDFSSPVVSGTVGALNGNASPIALSATIAGLSIPPGTTFWIRWQDTDLIPGSDDALAVDDFSLTAFGGPTTPALSIDNASVTEGDAGTTTATFTVSLSIPAGPGGVTYDIATADGSATAPSDYAAMSLSSQVIPEGSTSATFDVTINGDTTFEGDESFVVNVTNVTGANVADGQGAGTITNDDAVAIRDVQATTHLSPLNGQNVVLVPSVVTALRTSGSTRGFYLQDPNPDADAATSEGIFVFTGSSSDPTSLVSEGDLVRVGGRVSEFRAANASLTITELVGPLTVTLVSSGNALPAPVVIGAGGRVPPAMVIEDDATGDAETSGVFDPAQDGLDFYESLEGMLVQVNDAVATGPRSDFGSNHEISVLADDGADGGVRTPRGGVLIRPNDFNPERVILNDFIAGGPTLPAANVGDRFPGATVGVMDYSFGNFKLEVISLPPLASGGLAREVTTAPAAGELAVATFNVENLSPNDPRAKFEALADQIVDNLRSPDVVALEEIQDNNGTTNDGTVDANVTLDRLVAAIAATGGPAYQWRQINPVNGADGGAPGGNIRQGFLFRADRGLAFVDRPGGTSTAPTTVVAGASGPELSASPGRIDPANTAWNTSRKPLVGEFTYRGETVFVVVNHFNSKGGDDPLFGRFQPPTRSSEVQRHQQAQVVNDFVDSILSIDGGANVVVLGDINDFDFSDTVSILKGGVLHNLMDTLPQDQRYSYVFEGNSQVLDQILVSNGLNIAQPAYDVVHVNAEFADQQSDHDPSVTLVDFDDVWTFTGFLQPVDNGGVLNSVRAGQSVPVKFQLGGDRGLDILATGSPTSATIPCAGGAPVDPIEETATAGASGLQYDASTQTYTYVWKTQRTWSGTCRRFVLRLDDGTVRTADFRFN